MKQRAMLDVFPFTVASYDRGDIGNQSAMGITSDELNSEQLLPFVKTFPIAGLDDALSQ
ncbi:MAG: hypothetical protein ACJAUZ_002593 [Flavobacteriaceae bacterium]|jgi:hypothetical protein